MSEKLLIAFDTMSEVKQSSVSVVVPIYPPHFKFIPSLLQQLEKQTIQPNEIIFALSECDDKKAEELRNTYKNCIFLNTTEKQFAGANRNRGKQIAKGDIIMFLDADDVYHPQKIEVTK